MLKGCKYDRGSSESLLTSLALVQGFLDSRRRKQDLMSIPHAIEPDAQCHYIAKLAGHEPL